MKLGIPDALRLRHPYPGPGLAIRITGAIDAAQLHIAREADKIFIDEIMRFVFKDVSGPCVSIGRGQSCGRDGR